MVVKWGVLLALGILICAVPALAFDSTIDGDRNLGQPWNFSIAHVSGNLDADYSFTVYDYRDLGGCYTYWSLEWGQKFTKVADPGKKYLAVWVNGELEGTDWWGWGQERFNAWVWGNTTIAPEAVLLNDLPKKYGSDVYYPAVIYELQNLTRRDDPSRLLTRQPWAWKDGDELDRMCPGPSEAWDGYIIYQVPENAAPEDIRIAGGFYAGTPIWWLTPHTIDQKVKDLPRADAAEQQALNSIRGARGSGGDRKVRGA
jgi:hypothetical protein